VDIGAREATVDLELSVRAEPACTVVGVAGELDRDTRPMLEDFLLEAVEGGARQVVLDLSGVSFMDSNGLGLVVDVLKRLRGMGGRLCLAALQDQVRNVLILSAVDQVITVYDTAEAAERDMPPSVVA
jgi:anti-sigma B factor antagonist